MTSLLSKLAVSIFALLLAALSIASQSQPSEAANLNRMIEHFRKLEEARTRIIADLEANRVTLVSDPPDWPKLIKNDEIRDRFVFEFLLREAKRDDPNYQQAIADGEKMAQNYIRSRETVTRGHLKTAKEELITFRASRQKLQTRLANLQAKPTQKDALTGTWTARVDTPFSWYEYRWDITSTGSDTWKIEQTLTDTNHGFHKPNVGKKYHNYTLVKNGDRYEVRGEEVDKNPGNPGSFLQTGTLTLKDGSLSGEGVHKGTALTHWIKFTAKKNKQ